MNHRRHHSHSRLLSIYFYQYLSAHSHQINFIAMSTHFSAESSQAPSRTHTPFGIDDADLFYCPPPIRFQVTDPNNHVTETCPPSFYDLPPLSQKPERLRIQEAQWQARARAKKMPTVPRPIQPRPRRLPAPPLTSPTPAAHKNLSSTPTL